MVLFWSQRKDAANSLSFGSHSIGWSLKTGNMWETSKESWDNQITWPLDLACFQHDLDSKSSTLHLLILMCLHPLLLLSCHRVRTLRCIQNHKIGCKSNKAWDQLTQSQATHLIFDSKILICPPSPSGSPFDLVWLSTDPMPQVLDLPKFHQHLGSEILVAAHHAANWPQILKRTFPSLRKHVL